MESTRRPTSVGGEESREVDTSNEQMSSSISPTADAMFSGNCGDRPPLCVSFGPFHVSACDAPPTSPGLEDAVRT